MLSRAPMGTDPWPHPHVGICLSRGELGWSSLCRERRRTEVSASVFPQRSSSTFLGHFGRQWGHHTGAGAAGMGHVPTKGRAGMQQKL